MERVPVHIISGFLGSGKTTAILKLLHENKDSSHWAVMINEFGKISIDSQTLQSFASAGTVFEIAGGCICCSAKEYFQKDLEHIINSGKFNRIIVEPSGLGGIDMVCEIVESVPSATLMPIVCMVDIFSIENKRLQLNMIYKAQISKADFIVFSKCDLLQQQTERQRLIEKFKTLFPEKMHLLTDKNLLHQLIVDVKSRNDKCNKFDILSIANPELSYNFYIEKNYIFGAEKIFTTDSIKRFFNEHQQIIRAKGHLHTEKGWQLFNFTLSGCTFKPCAKKNKNELVTIVKQSEFFSSDNLFIEIE